MSENFHEFSLIFLLAEQNDVKIKLLALQTLPGLLQNFNSSNYASRIIHPLMRVMDSNNEQVVKEVKIFFTEFSLNFPQAMKVLIVVVKQLGSTFLVFAPSVNKTLYKLHISNLEYENIVAQLQDEQENISNQGQEVEGQHMSGKYGSSEKDSKIGLTSPGK